MKRFLATAACALAAVFAPLSAAQARTEILFNSFFPPQHFLNLKVLRGWARDVEKATDGRVKINFPAKSLAPPPEQWEVVTQGIADGAFIFNGFAQNRIDLPRVAHLPWLARDSAEASSVALWRTYDRFFADKGEYADVKLLTLFTASGGEFYSLKPQALGSVAELKSTKLWALPGTPADILKGIEAPIVSGPAVRIHEIVSRGLVDAFVGIPYIDTDAFKAGDYVKAVTEFERKIITPSFSLFISTKKWEGLDEADKAALMKLSGEALARRIGAAFDEANSATRARFEKKGVKFVAPGPDFVAELTPLGQPLVEAWKEKARAKGVDADAAIDFYKAQIDAGGR